MQTRSISGAPQDERNAQNGTNLRDDQIGTNQGAFEAALFGAVT
ncbi:hypothetical protein KABACHOK_04970 [Brevundimonas phage vB_BpoS-Kabachok]|uniref:Uncharacterized protein n=1 Tax=Brevundimonas phage vB_BpoS-Kabachok TaxID=2948600 RepID=A0A9E7MPS3_9CAUD|nr:hypothetical protein KABACHOK_04970 [Brevundimonas phage vB_BpoS-Kabachok]